MQIKKKKNWQRVRMNLTHEKKLKKVYTYCYVLSGKNNSILN